jgi:MYXO-CTERM domain-containing protein
MIPVLAHQGGWDEILLPALVVLGLLWASRRRQRREAAGAPTEERQGLGTCAYCGAPLPEDAPRCPSCGFRVTTG